MQKREYSRIVGVKFTTTPGYWRPSVVLGVPIEYGKVIAMLCFPVSRACIRYHASTIGELSA